VLETRPSLEFNFESGKRKLTGISTIKEDHQFTDFATPGVHGSFEADGTNYEAGYTTHQGKALRLSAWIDLENQLSIGCAGAVLTYLQRRRSVQYLPGNEDASAFFRVSAVEMFTLKDIMYCNDWPFIRNQG
jgi:DNA mismatch repair protein MSH5